MKELICIVCPKGCHLQVDETKNFSVTGHSCPRGEKYGREELKNPTRVITSTVCIKGGIHRRCPVKTDGVIPKHKILEAMALLDDVILEAPVVSGQIVKKDICGTGVNFVTSRSMQVSKLFME